MYPINIVQFTCLARENFGMFKELCGEKSLKNVVIVTNMWPEKQTEKDKCTRRVERLCAEEELFGLDMADKLASGAISSKPPDQPMQSSRRSWIPIPFRSPFKRS